MKSFILSITTAFLLLPTSLLNATNRNVIENDISKYYHVEGFQCPSCGQETWYIAFDQLGDPYHGICFTCLHEHFYD